MEITVVGSGSWGSAFARLLVRRGHDVQVLALTREEAAELNATHQNPHFLPGIVLPAEIRFVAIADADITDAGLVVYAVPTQAVREVARWVALRRRPDALQLSLAKGYELHSLKRPSEVIEEETGAAAAALSGPNHAEEVGRDMPSATVIAAADEVAADALQTAITSDTFRVYTNDDVVGVEFCGAVKNPIAVAVGMSDGLGFGDNSRASLITRSLAEVTRLGISQGAHIATFTGLAGIGDLIATCTSRHSRNRLAGELLAKGASPAEVEKQVGQVVEGIPTAHALHDLAARLDIDMPVTENVYHVLEGLRTPQECVADLMGRTPKRSGTKTEGTGARSRQRDAVSGGGQRMKIAVFGGTGTTGRLLIAQALSEGHVVVALARHPEKLVMVHERLAVVAGDLANLAAIAQTVEGADGVISLLGQGKPVKGTPIAHGTRSIIAAMEKYGVRRIVVVATASAADPRDAPPLRSRFFIGIAKIFLRPAYKTMLWRRPDVCGSPTATGRSCGHRFSGTGRGPGQ